MPGETYNREMLQSEYERLGYRHGWTFMTTPEATLRRARVAVVGLNPGGGGPDDAYEYEGVWDVPGGNAYYVDKFGANDTETPIQRQVQAWHSILGILPSDSFCAYFVPFRSRDWDDLARKNEALAFATGLWRWVLSQSPASLIVSMGKRPGATLAKLLDAHLIASLPTGWEPQMIDVWESAGGRRIIGMPHPSRFQLLNRANGASEVAEASLRTAAGLAQ